MRGAADARPAVALGVVLVVLIAVYRNLTSPTYLPLLDEYDLQGKGGVIVTWSLHTFSSATNVSTRRSCRAPHSLLFFFLFVGSCCP